MARIRKQAERDSRKTKHKQNFAHSRTRMIPKPGQITPQFFTFFAQSKSIAHERRCEQCINKLNRDAKRGRLSMDAIIWEKNQPITSFIHSRHLVQARGGLLDCLLDYIGTTNNNELLTLNDSRTCSPSSSSSTIAITLFTR